MTRDYASILADYDTSAMLWRLNDVCGTGDPLTLTELQEIRRFVERLHKEQTRPIKTAFVCTITLFHDGSMVEFSRRGKGPHVQRRYQTDRRRWFQVYELCQKHGEVYNPYNRGYTVWRICQYMPQG